METAFLPERPAEHCTRCAEVCARKLLTKLAGAKTTLYNPYLASFKKAFHDTTLGKLSNEHSRTTLPPGIDNLPTEKYFNYDPPSCFIPKFGMMDLQELDRTQEEEKFDESVRKTLEDVYQKTQGAFTMPIGRVIKIPTVKKISYLNFRVRLLTPEPSQKWRQFVHEKNLLYPYGGAEFVRRKFNKTGELDAKSVGNDALVPNATVAVETQIEPQEVLHTSAELSITKYNNAVLK